MGSAVVKPLTRRRGKIKKNKVAVDPAKGNEGLNATGNCEKSVNRKVNSLPSVAKNLRQPFFGKPCKVNVNNTQSSRKMCCTYPFLNGKVNSYDSDEELCQIQVIRKESESPSQTKNNQCNGTHPSENSTKVNIPSQAPTCTNLVLPSQSKHSCTGANVASVSNSGNNISFSEVRSPHTSFDGKDNNRSEKQLIEPEVCEIELTEVMNLEDQDVSRDARTPSPEYDDLEEVKVMNPNPSSTEPCAASSPLEGFGQSSETRIIPTSDVDVSISKTQLPAPERRGEQRLEVSHMVFIKQSLSKEHMGNEYQGGGEPLTAQLDYSQEVKFLMQDTKPHTFEAQFEDFFLEKDTTSIQDDRCVPLDVKSPRSESSKSNMSFTLKAESDLPLECNENNAINSTHNFGFTKDALLMSRSNHSSSTSLYNKGKIPQSDKSSDILSLNNPHVEEVLAVGEEFMDDIDEGFLQQKKAQSPYHETGNCLTSMKEDGNGENLPLFSLKNNSNIDSNEKGSPRRIVGSPRRTVGSSHSSLCSSKNSEISLGQHHSRPASGARPSARDDVLLAHNNIKIVKPFPRPSSAANELRAQSSNQAMSCDKRVHSAGQNIIKCELEQGIVSVDDVMPKDSIIPSRECASKESLHNFGAIQSQSAASTTKQIQPVPSRTSTPGAVTTISVASNKVSSRPPSSKRSCSSSEQNQSRWRLNSCKQSTNNLDSLQTIARPQSVYSKQSSNTSRPPSGLSSHLQCGLEVSAEGDDMVNNSAALTSSHICSVGETPVAGGAETALTRGSLDLLNVKDNVSVGSKSRRTPPTPLAVLSTTELTKSPPDISDGRGSPNHWKAETLVEACDRISPYDHGCFPGLDTKSNPTTKSFSRSSMSSKIDANDDQEEPSQESLATSKGLICQSQPSLSSRTDCLTTKTSGSQIRANNEEGPFNEASSSSALAAQPCGLSPDKIGNIRKQLYEEGLKPSEREGGVAFFIPVTEDGLLPQIDGATVAERLTKTKKASLNYEERMFLANINRQVQLSKRKEFAVRDIRNVKGATSSSDGSDRTKQSDDVDEFDASF